jgi:hypothetical protein
MSVNATVNILRKLKQIEELGGFALAEMPAGLGKAQIRQIISLAKYISTEIELGCGAHCSKRSTR